MSIIRPFGSEGGVLTGYQIDGGGRSRTVPTDCRRRQRNFGAGYDLQVIHRCMHLAADVITDHLADFHIRCAHADVVLTVVALTIHILPIAAMQHQRLLPVTRPTGEVHDVDTLLVALIEDPLILSTVADRRRSDRCGVVHATAVSGLYRTVVKVAVGRKVIEIHNIFA